MRIQPFLTYLKNLLTFGGGPENGLLMQTVAALGTLTFLCALYWGITWLGGGSI